LIVAWGVDGDWLNKKLSSFDGFAQGYTHPIFPVLDLSCIDQLSHVVFAADFSLANDNVAFGFLAGTHAVGIFLDGDLEVLNRIPMRRFARSNLPR